MVDGGIVDANEAETRDERTYEELLNGVWHDLRLTASTGAYDKVDEAKADLVALKEQEYADLLDVSQEPAPRPAQRRGTRPIWRPGSSTTPLLTAT